MALHRLFVAIDLPEEVKDELSTLPGNLPGARWVPLEQLHLTLRFIGEVDDATLLAVRAGLAKVTGTPFPLALQGIGHFPPGKHPRVLWVGLDAGTPLLDLQQQVETAVQDAGLSAEERPFSPHITLARFRETPAAPVLAFEERQSDFHCEPFTVSAFHLYESILTGKGAIHQRVASYNF